MEGRRPRSVSSLSEILAHRAEHEPTRLAYLFLPDGTSDQVLDLTYRELADRAEAVAAALSSHDLARGRVVLALDPGLEYVAALYGILRAGATAVPAFPPVNKRASTRFRSIVEDCHPDVVIVDARMTDRATALEADLPPEVPAPCWMVVDEGFFTGQRGAVHPVARADRPALLQYTSGSTGDPKGIMLTQGNLLSNCDVLERHAGVEADRVGLSWLPPYHDMGLMGTIMFALYGGWPLVMMAPAHFVQQPYRWLKAITDFRVTISVGPNFAFDLCNAYITDEELTTLDLSSVRQMFCGSEPIASATLDAFRERFASCGYDEGALIPCYGLAEATLFVSGKPPGTPVRYESLTRTEQVMPDPDGDTEAAPASARGAVPPGPAATPVVSCGTPAPGHEVVIVDPQSRRPAEPGRIGEIWVRGPNVAAGYLDRARQSAETFAARRADLDTGQTYLRTGDLGFMLDKELFVTGRMKDLIVIAGRNVYPQDVERTVCAVHEKLRACAAFSVAGTDGEELVVVAEFRGTARQLATEGDGLRDTVVAAVVAEHGVRPVDVHFAPVGAIPMTTSGKVRRNATRTAYAQGTLRGLRAQTGSAAQPVMGGAS